MLANTTVKFASAALLIISGIGTTPFRFGEIRANRPTVTPVLGSSQSGIEPKVIEQKDRSGNVLARLRITPGTRPGEFRFEVEDFNQPIPVRAIGTGMISDTEVAVQLVESRSGTRLSLRGQAHQIMLSLDRLGFSFVVDRQVRALVEEVQRRIASGADDAELIDLARELDRAFKIQTGYRPFLRQVRNSPAFDVLKAVRSLMMTVSREEVEQNIALAVIDSATRFLAPSPISPRASLAPELIEPQQQQQNCTQQFWDTVRNICGPMTVLLEALCITMASIEWLICLTSYF
ncbi:MAG: hypothetical protein N0A16_02495 [Blastocatellia bacterium]|nr:hypothetical protein [Blastocatellia bacterium]